jgi:hypothetical protein
MTTPFKDMLASFHDELSSIVDEQKRSKEEGMATRGDSRPFSSMLTQDEEPYTEASPTQVEEPEPEVYVRGG